MVSKRIKYARAHLSHKEYTKMLAKPNWRRYEKDLNNLKNPFKVSRAALKCRPSKRIKVMAQPKFITDKFSAVTTVPSTTKPPPKSMITPKLIRRLRDLSLPKRNLLLSTKQYPLEKAVIDRTNELLKKLEKSRYQKYRVICNSIRRQHAARERRLKAKFRKVLKKPEDWERHKKVLERIAAPRKIPEPPQPVVSNKGVGPDPTRLEILAQPVSKPIPETRDPFAVAPSALIYETSERTKQIAQKKQPYPVLEPRIPGYVSMAAKNAVASERIKILAEPATRPPGREIDLKENAFSVPPAALKAVCSPRVAQLAIPKKYGKN